MKAYHGLLTLFICVVLSACRTTHTEPIIVDHVKIDTLRLISHTTDSIYLHDSIFTLVKGDTTLIEKWHTLNKYIYKTDTLYQSKVDSIPVPVTIEVTKEVKYTPWYSRILAWIGLISMIFIAIYIGIKSNVFCHK